MQRKFSQKAKLVTLQCCIVFLLLFSTSLLAQYRIDTWTSENGLPQNSVSSLLQSKTGYLWGTTRGGIFRFDGVRFKVFNKSNSNGLEETRFKKVLEDGYGRLWFLGESFALAKYENKEFKTYREGDGYKGVIQSDQLSIDVDGNLIFSTTKAHYRYLDGRFESFKIPSSSFDSVISFSDSKGGIWITDRKKKSGVATFRRIVNGSVTEFDLPEGVSIGYAKVGHEDRWGNFWLLSNINKVYRVRNKEIQELPELKDSLGIVEDQQGNLWLGRKDGLYRLDKSEIDNDVIDFGKLQKESLTEEPGQSPGRPYVTSMAVVREGGLWLGSFNAGLISVSPQVFTVFTKEDWKTDYNNTYPIFEDSSENVWFGTWANDINWNNVLVRFDRDRNFTTLNLKELGPSISSLFEDSKKRLWIGAFGALGFVEKGKFRSIPTRKEILAIVEDDNETIYFATTNGVLSYKDNTLELFGDSKKLPDIYVTALLKTVSGVIWVGTKKGLILIKDGRLEPIPANEDVPDVHVRSLYEDEKGTIWIGTYDDGIIRYKAGQFLKITKENGLYGDNAFCLLEDDRGWFWINTNYGIYRVRKDDLDAFLDGKIERVTSLSYNKKDGLINLEGNGGKQPAGFRRKNGELWFPTQSGVAVVDPSKIPVNKLPPSVQIEEILVDRKEFKQSNDQILVQPGNTNLEIRYTGLSFANPDLIKFRYRLEGLETKWNEVGTRRTAFYNNLPPGEYNFRVIAANRDGVWNSKGATIKVIKTPYYYQTWWFLILAVSMIAAIIGYVFYARISKFREIAKTKTEYSKKVIESQENERKRIASELHDGLGQELVIITNRVYLAQQYRDDKEKLDQELLDIAESTSQTLEDIREITNELRPVLLDRSGLSKAIEHMLEKVRHFLEIESVIDNIDGLVSQNAEINIYRIIQESTSNIIKHSNASLASIEVKRNDNRIVVSIEDNGTGFDVNKIKLSGDNGLGLVGLRERTQALNGEFSIKSHKGEGTRIVVTIPVN